MFHAGLQAGFGGLLGSALLAELKAFGYTLLRVEQGVTLDDTRNIASEVLTAGMTPLVVLFQAEHASVLPPESWGECENEPDLAYPDRTIAPRGVMPHADYIQLSHRIAELAPLDVRLWAGAVSNPNDRGRAYLEATWPHCAEWERYGLSCHRYPHGTAEAKWSDPQEGFSLRSAEVSYLRRVAAGRPLAITEGGFHRGLRTSRSWWGRRKTAQWSDDDVAGLWAQEWAFWRMAGVECAVRYQINDGPDPDEALDNYGIRDVTGAWWPSAPV
jgi:hypothetical protein